MDKLKKLKTEYMGPDYDYAKNVPNPKSLGISGDGNFNALIKDINGLVKYVNILTFGDPPLGYNFFLIFWSRPLDSPIRQFLVLGSW